MTQGPCRIHALRGAVKVFLRWFRLPGPDCGAAMSHDEGGPGERWTHRTGDALSNPEKGYGAMERRAPARRPAALAPARVAAGHSPGPSRHGGAMPRPTPRTSVAGSGATGDARGPRTSCRCVRCRARARPRFAGRWRTDTGRVVPHRRRRDAKRRRARPRGGPGRAGQRAGAGPASRWRCRQRCSPARWYGVGHQGLAPGGPWARCPPQPGAGGRRR